MRDTVGGQGELKTIPMKITAIISEHKRIRKSKPLSKGAAKRVMAIVEIDGRKVTRHIDV